MDEWKDSRVAADVKEGWIGCNELWLLELVSIYEVKILAR